MKMYVQYPGEKTFFLVVPGGKDKLTGAFCRNVIDAPVLPVEKLNTLARDVHDTDPSDRPRVYLVENVEKLRSLNFPEGPAVGYITRHGQYLSADHPRLASLLQKGAEPTLYKLGWVKIYPGPDGKPENGLWSHAGLHLTQGLPCRLQASVIRQLNCAENPANPGFLQLAADEVDEALARLAPNPVKRPGTSASWAGTGTTAPTAP